MGRVFSNGRSADFVINPLKELASQSSQIAIAAPYVTKVDELIQAAQDGKRVELLVGLNATTDPDQLRRIYRDANVRVRYYTHRRFHAKIYLFDSAAMVGSSNLTDGGLQSNREGTILIEDSDDPDAIEDLRAVFKELWDFAAVLTDDALRRFSETRRGFSPADVDKFIYGKVGEVEPPNISVESWKMTAERMFLEGLRRRIGEYRNAFLEVSRLLEENGLHRVELDGTGAANQANRFLSWVRRTYAPGDEWESTPLRTREEDRHGEILRLGKEWRIPENDNMHEGYLRDIRNVGRVFGDADTIDSASREELTRGLTSLQAFSEQLRFVKGGTANLPIEFWRRNNEDVNKVKNSLKHLLYGAGEFAERLHDLLYEAQMKMKLFGMSCALELFGTLKPEQYPPINGRMLKALRYLGFNVRGA